LAARLEERRYFILLLLTILYACGAMLHARSKPLWYDEIVTVVAASAPDAAGAWKTAQAFDANPPLVHLLTHFAMRWFGPGEVAVRLPAIAGFWIFCLCLFRFTRRRAGILYALVALLLPIATEAYNYAFEARAYGPELAFCGIALVAWQAAAEGRGRLLADFVLGVSLAGAIFCHYYAIAVYLPLAGAEAFRSWRARRIEWGVWAAFAMGGIPLVWYLSTVSRVIQGFSRNTWAPAYPEQAIEFWELGLQHSLSFLVLLLAVLAIWLSRRDPAPEPPPDPPPVLPAHELIAAALFLAIPLLVVESGLLVTHMFTPRYALLGLTGVALLVPMIAARLSGGSALTGCLLASVALLPLGFVSIEIPPVPHPFADETILAKAVEQGPVVVADGQLFLQMWYYAPDRLKSRLLFLANDQAAVKYMGFDAMDAGLRNVSRWSTFRVMEYRDFASPGREFLLYQNTLHPGWVLPTVLAGGGTADVRTCANYRLLYGVRINPNGPSNAAPGSR
jgi:cytochrome b561